jgi:hypothetical protein
MIKELLHKITGLTRPTWVKNADKQHFNEDNSYLHVYIDGALHKFTREAVKVAADR